MIHFSRMGVEWVDIHKINLENQEPRRSQNEIGKLTEYQEVYENL